MKRNLFPILILFCLTACSANHAPNDWAYDEYERMIEPTSTNKETALSYDADIPVEPVDRDGDGWADNFDLCPEESSADGLAGCAPLSLNRSKDEFSLWYTLPIDPSGRINVFGDHFLVHTNYELGALQIYDLSDGKILRTFQIPDILNDSPTLLPEGILLKNYDQQRWCLLDYDGNEIYAANEELEIINESNDLLISRTDNTIFLRKLSNIRSIYNQFPGRYVSFTPDGMLSITNPEACTITVLDIHNFTNNESYLFSPGNAICTQTAQFSNNGQYTFFTVDGFTHLLSLQHAEKQYSYPGIPVGISANTLLLLDGDVLYQQGIPDGEKNPILNLYGSILQKSLVNQNVAAFLTRNIETFHANITLINLETYKPLTTIEADSMQFFGDQFFVWSFGDAFITFYNQNSEKEISQLETPPISAVQTALNENIFLVSGQDHQLYIYGPEQK